MNEHAPLILIVDDDELLRTSMAMQLQGSGYEVATAKNGNEGYDKALELHPTLIIMDYQMPEQDGIATITKLRTDDWGKHVPIICATNVYDAALINRLIELDVPDYLIKSDLSLSALESRVRKYVIAGS